MRKETKFFHYGHVRRPSWSPKVATVLQRRALAMNPRYIFVVSYQISSNMVASVTTPPVERVGSFFFLVYFCLVCFLIPPRLLVHLFVFFYLGAFPSSCWFSCLRPKPFPL